MPVGIGGAEGSEVVVVDREVAFVIDDHPSVPRRDIAAIERATQRRRSREIDGVDVHVDAGAHVGDHRVHDIIAFAALIASMPLVASVTRQLLTVKL
jgi:hypothetical protein